MVLELLDGVCAEGATSLYSLHSKLISAIVSSYKCIWMCFSVYIDKKNVLLERREYLINQKSLQSPTPIGHKLTVKVTKEHVVLKLST